MRSGSRCPAFYGEIPPMRWGILDDDGGYFYCITYRRAGEVLFDTEGMCGNPAEGGASGETAADATKSCAPKTSLTPWDIQGRRIYDECGVSQTLSGCDGGGGQRGSVNIFQHSKPLVQSEPQGGPIVLKIRQPKIKGMGGNGPMWQEDMSYCLACHQDQTLFEATNYGKRCGIYIESARRRPWRR